MNTHEESKQSFDVNKWLAGLGGVPQNILSWALALKPNEVKKRGDIVRVLFLALDTHVEEIKSYTPQELIPCGRWPDSSFSYSWEEKWKVLVTH